MVKEYIINIIFKVGMILIALFSMIYLISYIYIIVYSVFYNKLDYLGEICLKIVGYTTMTGVFVFILILLWLCIIELIEKIKK